MTDWEQKLKKEKELLQQISAPPEFEERLRSALFQSEIKRKKRVVPSLLIAAALLFLTFATYHYNAFAYYGKKLLGYEELNTETLELLNEKGHIQYIDKSVTLENGTVFTLEGIMNDENQLILYYDMKNRKGVHDDVLFFALKGKYNHSAPVYGTSSLNEEKTVLKGIQSFEAVNSFTKELTLQLSVQSNESRVEEIELTFPYNPNAAMATVLKKRLHKTLEVDQGKVTFQSILATPTRTKLSGKLNVKNLSRVPSSLEGVQLLVDGKNLKWQGSSTTTSWNGTHFEVYFDPLSEDVQEIEVVLDSFAGYKTVKKRFDLSQKAGEISNKELLITSIEKTKAGIQLGIATEQGIMFEGVEVVAKGKSYPLSTTLRSEHYERGDEMVYNERILLFEMDEWPETLYIEGMHYQKPYQHTFTIPIN